MFTRLLDFDTVGSDPMFFKYTYNNEKQKYLGSDYRSNFTPWGLPNEDWKKHPAIKLTGKAKITSAITIFQNGKGNFAREMRVAGISPEGKIGYYKKQLNDKSWAFVEAPLILDSSQFLDTNSDIKFSYGKKNEFKYCGNLIIDGKEIKNLNFRIPNFAMSEGSCTLEISWQTGKTSLTLHPVEMWTYLVRKNPGLDGTSKKFFVTIEYPLDFFSKIDNPEVKNILQKITGKEIDKVYRDPRGEWSFRDLQIIKDLGYKIKLDTNGYNPSTLKYLYIAPAKVYFFSMTSRPPRYLRRHSGTTMEPSARWFCSTRAGKIREVARPEPLRVCRNSGLPVSSRRKRMLPRRAW